LEGLSFHFCADSQNPAVYGVANNVLVVGENLSCVSCHNVTLFPPGEVWFKIAKNCIPHFAVTAGDQEQEGFVKYLKEHLRKPEKTLLEVNRRLTNAVDTLFAEFIENQRSVALDESLYQDREDNISGEYDRDEMKTTSSFEVLVPAVLFSK